MSVSSKVSSDTRVGPVLQVLVLFLLIATTIWVCWIFARILAPTPGAAAVAPYTDYDRFVMFEQTDPEAIAETYRTIREFGSRYLGQSGMRQLEEYTRNTMQATGLELYEQKIYTVVPKTIENSIERIEADGSKLDLTDRVKLFPFMPNHFQPVVTPPQGLSGELIVLTPETIATRTDFANTIGILDTRPGQIDSTYNYNWPRYAQLGLKALIVSHPAGFEAMDWPVIASREGGLVSSVPINFVRLAATPEIFDYIGETVNIKVHSRFTETPSTTLIGILRAPVPTEEAIVVLSSHDAPSILPDLAPGSISAINSAAFIHWMQGLAAARATLTRDVIFISQGASVMGEDGINNILRVLQFNTFSERSNRLLDAFSVKRPGAYDGPPESEAEAPDQTLRRRMRPLQRRLNENLNRVEQIVEILEAFEDENFLRHKESTRDLLSQLRRNTREFFLSQFQYTLSSLVLERQEPVLQALLDLERVGGHTNTDEFARYLQALRRQEQANAIAGASPASILRRHHELAHEIDLRQRVLNRIEVLNSWHQRRIKQINQDMDVARIFSAYRDFGVLRPFLAPTADDAGGEVLSLQTESSRPTQTIDLLLRSAARNLPSPASDFQVQPIRSNQTTLVDNNCDPAPLHSYMMWFSTGYQNTNWVNLERQNAYQQWTAPVHIPFMDNLESLRGSFATIGEHLLLLAHGNGLLAGTQGFPWQRKNFGGQVLVSNVGLSIVPNFPLKNALVGARSVDENQAYSRPGYWVNPFYQTDPYGRFDLPEQSADFGVWFRMYSDGNAYTPLAAGFGEDGLIHYMKDEGEEGQRLFKSVNVPLTNERLIENTTIVTFRASPMAVLDRTNPQTFRDYSGIEFISTDGLLPFTKRCAFNGAGFVVNYLPPEERAYVLMQAGTPANDQIRRTRAFLLGPSDDRPENPEINGMGYLVADNTILQNVPLEAARSLARVNEFRLHLQNRHHMADRRTQAYHDEARRLIQLAEQVDIPHKQSVLYARDAVSYGSLNHPVLRRSVTEAVIGILWYLGLLVPFIFFAEKLVFCFTDIRKQLAAQAAIFLLVFALLRVLHPAFEMVRSSLMILLGFIIILISLGITLLFTGKARENLEELRRKQGKVANADINPMGVLTSSFLVGLNNMHRRKVRTGLTCVTLILLTFVMISFTSTQNDLVDETRITGAAGYQGLLVKHRDFQPVSGSEVFALRSKFGNQFTVNERRFFIGHQDWNERKRVNPSLSIQNRTDRGTRELEFDSVLKFTATEPLQSQIHLLTQNGWFLPEHERGDGLIPVILPASMAERLGITIDAVNNGGVTARINNREFLIWGIFDTVSLVNLRDLDGRDILPFDMERISTLTETSAGFTASVDEPRVSADRIVLAPLRDLRIAIADSNEVTSSIAIDMGNVSYRSAQETIERYLEMTGLPAFFGLDGIAYRGLQTRQMTISGLMDLLVPLLIAGLTVLNTMKGSVYERKNEIYVYNAVGIAPRYIFMMFLAEALVFVVVGSVMGYVLSQGVGRILTELGMTGGLNMTYASLSTIYASLAIGAAVFVSTIFPARSAMEIAAPAEESGWKMPEPDGDNLRFDLPFNFRQQGRIAVLAFFNRWLLEHGEGSAGSFYASIPELGVAEECDPNTGDLVPSMQLTVWLKPFDLAVSQRIQIMTPFDSDTQMFKAQLCMTRISGTEEAWLRLNHSFVKALRRHFLHWRALSEKEKNELFTEARNLMEQTCGTQLGPPATIQEVS